MICLYRREEEHKGVTGSGTSLSDIRTSYTEVLNYCNLLEFRLREQGKEYTKQPCTYDNSNEETCPGYRGRA
jgi:isopenicillin N synthase-like dioxygenase